MSTDRNVSHDRVRSENAYLHGENQVLRKDCDTLRLRLDVAKAEARRLWSENDALRKERGEHALAAKCEQDRLLLENEALRKELAVTRGELARVSVAHDRVADELRDLRQKLPTERVPTKQPPPGGRGDVWADIIAKLPADHPMRAKCIARRELGLARYGQPLRHGTAYRSQDLEEELLDAAAYAWRDRWPWALVLHLLAVAAEPATVGEKWAEAPAALRTRVQNLEVGLDTLRGWLARDRDLLTSATWCIASLVTNGDSSPAKDLLEARELVDEIHRTLTRRAGGER